MNYIKELMIDHDLTYDEAVEYMCEMADHAKDLEKYEEPE